MSSSSCSNNVDVVLALERRLAERSGELEEIHMQAAMDAQLTDTTSASTNARPVVQVVKAAKKKGNEEEANDSSNSRDRQDDNIMFDDYVNPNAVSNCLSPYVPASAERIAAFVSFANVTASDVLLDIGCGDGRVCIAAAKLTKGCRTVGLDVSPLCIAAAKQLVGEQEELSDLQCEFYEVDAALDPDLLLSGKLLGAA